MNYVPDWYEAILLALAAWRVFHLLGYDDILDRPRNWLVGAKASGKWEREKLGEFLECPFCLGFWVALVWWVAWLIFPTETLIVAVPWAIAAGVVGAQRALSS